MWRGWVKKREIERDWDMNRVRQKKREWKWDKIKK